MSSNFTDFGSDSDLKETSGGYFHRRVVNKAEAAVQPYLHRPDAISGRLKSLDREWDVERVIGLKAGALLVAGTYFGTTRDRRYFWIPALVGASLIQHAVLGWCLPSLLIRALGFRTRKEIDDERTALKVARGDFTGLSIRQSSHDLLRAVEAT